MTIISSRAVCVCVSVAHRESTKARSMAENITIFCYRHRRFDGDSSYEHKVTCRDLFHEKRVTRFLLRVTAAHSCEGGECLYALAGIKIPASAQITFKFFLKKLAIPCTYLFFKLVPRSFAPKQRRHFEIFRKGDGLSLVHLLGIKAVTLKS